MLSPAEAARAAWGQEFRRYITAAAVLRGAFTADEMSELFGITTGGMRGWWKGARPKAETLSDLADAAHIDPIELVRYVHLGGPPPPLVVESMTTPPPGPARGGRQQGRPHRAALDAERRGDQTNGPSDPQGSGTR